MKIKAVLMRFVDREHKVLSRAKKDNGFNWETFIMDMYEKVYGAQYGKNN